ncbi:MAG: nicotinate (nicotinamide) nucleotide adenylyltransferase [Anaerolineae bacterium]|nr:nicotinate (nicotinamide) nucleotide adenylyltransferase [Anaerolineae bacterium]
MRIGIFGGTFDPPHFGHLILAAEAQHQLQLDRVLWVLTPTPPHKPDQVITPVAIRTRMVLACIAGEPGFELSDVDICRPPPHYAIDTINIIRAAYPENEIVYLMGGDSLAQLHTWHRALEFLEACDSLGVIRRSDEDINLSALNARLPGLGEKDSFVPTMILGISSSEIRKRIANKIQVKYYLPAGVYKIIQEERLYQ